jgi:hypothetical protein
MKAVRVSLDQQYDKDSNVVSREVAGERILVPIRKGTADMAAIYVLNETGALIWNLMDGQRSLADIRDTLVLEYDVEPQPAAKDVLEIVERLDEAGLVRVVAHGV